MTRDSIALNELQLLIKLIYKLLILLLAVYVTYKLITYKKRYYKYIIKASYLKEASLSLIRGLKISFIINLIYNSYNLLLTY